MTNIPHKHYEVWHGVESRPQDDPNWKHPKPLPKRISRKPPVSVGINNVSKSGCPSQLVQSKSGGSKRA
jgi:hypothetical protein